MYPVSVSVGRTTGRSPVGRFKINCLYTGISYENNTGHANRLSENNRSLRPNNIVNMCESY